MKHIVLLLALITSLSLNAQSYNLTKDIESEYLEKIVVDNGDSLMIH